MLLDRLADVQTSALPWVDETDHQLLTNNDLNGRRLEMYSENGITYGIAIASAVGGITTTCGRGTSRCIGSSVPGSGLEPYFTVTCDTTTYLGPNKYHFSPAQSRTGGYDQWTPLRSYICDGMASTIRPTWKLMGYFPLTADCQALQSATYDESFCGVRVYVMF